MFNFCFLLRGGLKSRGLVGDEDKEIFGLDKMHFKTAQMILIDIMSKSRSGSSSQ